MPIFCLQVLVKNFIAMASKIQNNEQNFGNPNPVEVQDNKESMDVREQSTLVSTPLILDGTFFKIKSHLDNVVSAICTTCGKIIKGRLGATTNFRNHLKVILSFFY